MFRGHEFADLHFLTLFFSLFRLVAAEGRLGMVIMKLRIQGSGLGVRDP